MSETTAVPGAQPDPRAEGPPGDEPASGEPPAEGSRLVESMLDNLPAWAFIALAVSALYLVWATLVILEKYVGALPRVTP